jgi:hypothetical protein
MTSSDRYTLIFCVAALAAAGVLFAKYWRGSDHAEPKAFFYDLSEKKLFVGPSSLIPPAKGINNAEEDAVRAVVISTNGKPDDKNSWQIAYLEKYAPELKREFERARSEGTPPELSRASAQMLRFVKRPADPQWFPMNTREAGTILNEWLTAGPGGSSAVICTP